MISRLRWTHVIVVAVYLLFAGPGRVWSQLGPGCNGMAPSTSVSTCAATFDTCSGDDCGMSPYCSFWGFPGDVRTRLLTTTGISTVCEQEEEDQPYSIHCAFQLIDCTQETVCWKETNLDTCQWGTTCDTIIQASQAFAYQGCNPDAPPTPPGVIETGL